MVNIETQEAGRKQVVSVPEAQPGPTSWDLEQSKAWARIFDMEEQAEPHPTPASWG